MVKTKKKEKSIDAQLAEIDRGFHETVHGMCMVAIDMDEETINRRNHKIGRHYT